MNLIILLNDCYYFALLLNNHRSNSVKINSSQPLFFPQYFKLQHVAWSELENVSSCQNLRAVGDWNLEKLQIMCCKVWRSDSDTQAKVHSVISAVSTSKPNASNIRQSTFSPNHLLQENIALVALYLICWISCTVRFLFRRNPLSLMVLKASIHPF